MTKLTQYHVGGLIPVKTGSPDFHQVYRITEISDKDIKATRVSHMRVYKNYEACLQAIESGAYDKTNS